MAKPRCEPKAAAFGVTTGGNALPTAARPWPSVKQPTVRTDRPRGANPARHASVDTATRRSTAFQGDTRRDREKRPASHENSQPPSLLAEDYAADQRIRRPSRFPGRRRPLCVRGDRAWFTDGVGWRCPEQDDPRLRSSAAGQGWSPTRAIARASGTPSISRLVIVAARAPRGPFVMS